MNQRDVERDRLRKENHHLRQLLNAFHERQRVESQSVSGSAYFELDGRENINGRVYIFLFAGNSRQYSGR